MKLRFAHTTCPKCQHPVILVASDEENSTEWESAQYICAGNGIYGYGFCGTAFEIKAQDDKGDVDG